MLKPRKPSLHIVAVEPEDSPVLSGGKPGPHKIQGIGAGFVPDILDRSVIDEVVAREQSERAFDTARALARREGIPVRHLLGRRRRRGAAQSARAPEFAGKTIVVIVPDFAERYLSTALFEGL